jgi:hypothetical protein
MENKKPAIESIRQERGRLRTVHEMLKEALAVSPRDETFIPFYIAIGDYMEASMGRLHIQDINMLERLASKIDMNDPENEEIIAEVYRRLDGNQEHLKRYSACKQALESEGAAAVTDYEDASLAYVDYIHNRMGHHAPSTDLARKAFTEEDWVAFANIDEAYFAKERGLYESVLQTRPEGVPLGQAAEQSVADYRREKG